MQRSDPNSLAARIEAIEAGYEFLLAYAAQGREDDQGPGSGLSVREYLSEMATAMEGLADACAESLNDIPGDQAQAVVRLLEEDAGKALVKIQLVLAQPRISSQLIDNLNASIHVRALLTDLFLLDEVRRARESSPR